jgi:Flp pilus assembly protein TadD
MLAAVAALVMTGCNCTKKMQKMSSAVTAIASPAMLAVKGGQVPVDITVNFLPKTFEKSTTLKLTPVLVADNGAELAGEPKYVQGEKVKDNYDVIGNADGGQIKFSTSFPYDAKFSICTLELRVEGKCGKKVTEFAPLAKLPIAKGITDMAANVDYLSPLKLLSDKFQRVNTISKSAEIMFDINKSNVKKEQLTKEDVKALQDFVAQNKGSETVTLGAVQAKGYASPEGPVTLNDKLANSRSTEAQKAVAKTIGKNAKVDPSAYGEDWEGFQKLVQNSDIQDKELILKVLSMYSSSEQRDREIKNMSAAFKQLATDVLPKLRRTVLTATADEKGKSDEDLLAAAKGNPSSLGIEEALYIAPQIKEAAGRIALYKAAADKSGDSRAYNNLGVELARDGKLKEAAEALKTAASKGSDPVITDNIGYVALASGDVKSAADALSKSASPEAKAAAAFANGDYVSSTKGLTGYNLAVAQLANGDVNGAKSTLASVPASAEKDYLVAVIAIRTGDSKGAIANLKSAIAKDPAKRDKAKNDAEFNSLFDNADFKAL